MMLRSRASRPGWGLTKGLRAAAAILAGVAICTLCAGDAFAKKAETSAFDRRVDLEIGAGFVLGLSNDPEIDDTWLARLGFAIPIHDVVDIELAGGYIDGEDPDALDSDEEFDNFFADLGARLYVLSDPKVRIRPFFSMGYMYIHEGNGRDTDSHGPRIGVGLRMQLGERSGVTATVPFWFSANGSSNTLMMPSLSWFYSF